MVANLIELGFAEGHCKNALKNTVGLIVQQNLFCVDHHDLKKIN